MSKILYVKATNPKMTDSDAVRNAFKHEISVYDNQTKESTVVDKLPLIVQGGSMVEREYNGETTMAFEIYGFHPKEECPVVFRVSKSHGYSKSDLVKQLHAAVNEPEVKASVFVVEKSERGWAKVSIATEVAVTNPGVIEGAQANFDWVTKKEGYGKEGERGIPTPTGGAPEVDPSEFDF